MPHERRHFVRVSFDARALLATPNDTFSVHVQDLSLKGALITAPAQAHLQPGMLCQLTLALTETGNHIAMSTEVAHVEGLHTGLLCRGKPRRQRLRQYRADALDHRRTQRAAFAQDFPHPQRRQPGLRRYRAGDAADESADLRRQVVSGIRHRSMDTGHHRLQPLGHHRLLQLLPVAEVVVDQRRRHPGMAGDIAQRGRLDSLPAETGQRRIQQPGTQIDPVGCGTPSRRTRAGGACAIARGWTRRSRPAACTCLSGGCPRHRLI